LIQLVQVRNPLQPSDGRITHELEHVDGRHLDEYVAQVYSVGTELVVSVNAKIIPGDLWAGVVLRDGDCIVCAPAMGNSTLIRTLGSVALAGAALALTLSGAGTALGLALGVAATNATAVGTAILGSAVSIGGGLLISGIVSLMTPSQKTATPSYAFDGPHSLAQSGTVIPKGYGTMMWGGNVIASFIDVEGIDQYINVLVCFGYGPARNIGQIQINGKNVETYNNVQLYTRLGANNQPTLPNFNRVVNGYPQDTECLAGVPVVVPGTGDLTQILQVDIQFPDGVYFQTNDGNTIAAVITYLVEYAVSGSNIWQPVIQPLSTSDVVSYDPVTGDPLEPHDWCVVATDMPPNSGIVYYLDNGPHNPGDPWSGVQSVLVFEANGQSYSYNKTCVGEWQPTNPLLNQVMVNSWTAGYIDFIGASHQVLYNRTTIYGLAPGKYDVRVTKWGSARIHDNPTFGDNWSPDIGQDMWVHSVNEISLLDLSYPNMILVGVRALATSQLSGANINITAVVTHGLRTLDNNILPSALQVFEEDNPACVGADMMLDRLYGGGQWPGITAANIDRFIDEWVAWAELNDQLVPDGNGNSIRRHVFNGVFDNESDLWNQLRVVGQMSRAQVVSIGRDYGVFVDQADVPVQIFTMGNIVTDSFTETWMDLDDRANQVEIQFADSTRYYKQDNPIVYMDPTQQNSGVAIKNTRIDGKGITLPAQAWHRARFAYLGNQYLLRSGSFKCDVDAIACRPGNVAILQHDVPQWGWGGRTLPGSTASNLLLDRNDIPFAAGTNYNAIILHPSLLRYSGTIGTVTTVTDGTGAVTGTSVALSSFDNENRVTRIIINGVDCGILSASAGSVLVTPPPGFTPASGQAYRLYDTDVLETVPVIGVAATGNAIALGTPLSQVPQDYSSYFYGPAGTQKLIRIQNIRKASEFRATVEWIDYDARQYVDATPVIGETSAITTTNPGVTTLVANETFSKVSGSYIPNIVLSWKNGPDTVGVGIYCTVPTTGLSISNSIPQMLARLTNQPTSFTYQPQIGVAMTFIVVGFDINNNYANITTAPSVTITALGVATNLLLGSSFATGFTYWNLTARAGDSLVPLTTDEGEATYTIAGSTLATATSLLYQVVQPSGWVVGDYLMLSAYFEDSCAVSTAPNVGSLIATLSFLNSSSTVIGSAACSVPLHGVTPTLTRCNTPTTLIPAGTTAVTVTIGVGGTGLSIPVGSVLTFSHLLLEVSTSTQTLPSEWADIDAAGIILDVFQTGSSTGLRVQGSTIPSFTGQITFTSTGTTVTFSWTNLVILWPDGSFTYVTNSTLTITGLVVTTTYFAFLYWDVVLGTVNLAPPMTPIGTPALLSAAYDAMADAACKQDNRVSLTPGGMKVTTAAAGSTGGGSGGGPITCTVRGTLLQTPEGAVSNEILKRQFDAGEKVYLVGRFGPELIRSAVWSPVMSYQLIEVDGFEAFGASDTLTLKPEGGDHTWCSQLPSGTRVDTIAGFRTMQRTLVAEASEVLHIELVGPSHEYQAVEGVWTHNVLKQGPNPN
jgi:sulfur carrier protein ThiS